MGLLDKGPRALVHVAQLGEAVHVEDELPLRDEADLVLKEDGLDRSTSGPCVGS